MRLLLLILRLPYHLLLLHLLDRIHELLEFLLHDPEDQHRIHDSQLKYEAERLRFHVKCFFLEPRMDASAAMSDDKVRYYTWILAEKLKTILWKCVRQVCLWVKF